MAHHLLRDRALRILASDSLRLVTTLRAGCFRRSGLRVTIAGSIGELVERAAVLRPEVVIVAAETTATELRMLRRYLAGGRALLIRAADGEAAECGGAFDAVVSPDSAAEIAAALSPIMWLPQRRFERSSARIPALLERAGTTISGVALDTGAGGCGLLVGAAPLPGPSQLVLHRGENRRLTVPATPVWIDAFAPKAVRLGVAFAPLGAEMRALLADLAFWETRGEVIHLHGVIDQTTVWDRLLEAACARQRLDLEDVRIEESRGVESWQRFLERLAPGVELSLERISRAAAQTLRGRPALIERCRIASFFVGYDCGDCEIDAVALAERGHLPAPPECPTCGRQMSPRADD